MTITLHPARTKISARLAAIGRSLDVPFDAELFRFINPSYAKAVDIISGAGALHAAGRWNLAGAARLSYTSRDPETALSEALAHVRYYNLPTSKALPRVLVALRLKATRVLDLRDGQVRKALMLSEKTLRKLDWRGVNQRGSEAVTQAWGYALACSGCEAVIVPSAAEARGANVLVFPENLLGGSAFLVLTEIVWP
jgi:RES domain-containing protein